MCSGPRQAVNALTLLGVYNAKVSAAGNNVESTLIDFFAKLKSLFDEDARQAVILMGMLFTLVIWVFSALSLLLAFLFFVFFLWGYIPSAYGGLSGFCSQKINKRLTTIVTKKVNKAIFEEERRRKKAEFKAAKKTGERPAQELQATIPDVGDDKLPEMPMLHRNDTMTTLPPYTSRPGTPGSFELGSMDQKRPSMPSRSGTSASSFSTRAPLLNNAAEPGYGRSGSPAPSIPTLPDVGGNNYGPPSRTGTSASQRSFGGPPLPQLTRTNTGGSNFGGQGGYSASPATYSADRMPSLPQTARSPVGSGGFGRPPMSSDPYANGRSSPAPSAGSYRGNPNGGQYPPRSVTNPVPPRGPAYPPQRNMTAPLHRAQPSNESWDYDRSPTSVAQWGAGPRPGFGNGWNSDVESQRGPGPRY